MAGLIGGGALPMSMEESASADNPFAHPTQTKKTKQVKQTNPHDANPLAVAETPPQHPAPGARNTNTARL